ncbi:RNA polymerase sigma factor [Sphingomonas endophytica]|uniref:RNA polymerase sigma-70 factor (ECF subfamily) n=1 Tax=Sphingomonas endophytica TaxID=869719 RepID=A0ABR6N5L6_9SPHN|nr:sigma-70 family RNA polymerase sigma factor [Sphingomonas endophytica]MBB5725799.1 RNA polymerase sigma-70 factor (ECF subfamily) [Sphingomonas endophytica]
MNVGVKSDWTAEEIFRLHYDWLRRWLRPRTRLSDHVDEVAAETMVRIVRVVGQQAIREPRAIMTVIARRLLLDLNDKDALRRHYEAAIAHLPPALEPSAEERMIILEALQRIEHVLKPLSVKTRSALLLSHVDGLRHAEIAQRLGLSVSMIRRHIATAMRACYQEFEHDG